MQVIYIRVLYTRLSQVMHWATLYRMTSLRIGFGRAVARLRRAAGFSQEAFALSCKVHRTYMTGIERGKHNVSLDILERIAKGLRVDTGQLMAEAEKERRSSSARG
ncbi:MAG: helix-turn-helix transcriptional regulator [Chloroflexota bacterium]